MQSSYRVRYLLHIGVLIRSLIGTELVNDQIGQTGRPRLRTLFLLSRFVGNYYVCSAVVLSDVRGDEPDGSDDISAN